MVCPSPSIPPLTVAPPLANSGSGQILFFIAVLYAPIIYYLCVARPPRDRAERRIIGGVGLSLLCMVASWAVNYLVFQPWQMRVEAWQQSIGNSPITPDCFAHVNAITTNAWAQGQNISALSNILQLAALLILLASFLLTFYGGRSRKNPGGVAMGQPS